MPTDQTGFAHGVASGEVTRTSVRLWTHWSGPGPLQLTVRDGAEVVATAEVGEALGQPHVFRALLDGLAPDVRHDYEFSADDGNPASGSFRTLPPDGVPLRFDVVSCAKYNAGFFNTYKVVAARDDLHFVLHLGDYIYEAGQVPRGTQTPSKAIGRPFEPLDECLAVVTVDGTEASCEWWGLETVAEPSDVAEVGHRATLTRSA